MWYYILLDKQTVFQNGHSGLTCPNIVNFMGLLKGVWYSLLTTLTGYSALFWYRCGCNFFTFICQVALRKLKLMILYQNLSMYLQNGVPQGSMYTPFLFTICTASVKTCSSFFKPHFFTHYSFYSIQRII